LNDEGSTTLRLILIHEPTNLHHLTTARPSELRHRSEEGGNDEDICAEGENRTPDALLFHRLELDYLIIPRGCRALVWGYCWGSPTSLYTFPDTYTHQDLARGRLSKIEVPRIHPIFPQPITGLGPKEFRQALCH